MTHDKRNDIPNRFKRYLPSLLKIWYVAEIDRTYKVLPFPQLIKTYMEFIELLFLLLHDDEKYIFCSNHILSLSLDGRS